MTTAVMAVDAARINKFRLEDISLSLLNLKEHGAIQDIHVVSIIHPDSYALPYSVFRNEKKELVARAKSELRQALDDRLKPASLEVLATDSQSVEQFVKLVTHHGRRLEADLFVAGSSGKSAFSYLFEGSFTETAALNTPMPVLVLGPGSGHVRFQKRAKLLLVLCSSSLPSVKSRMWVADLARSLKSELKLATVDDERRWWSAKRVLNPDTVELVRREFIMMGVEKVDILTSEPISPGEVPAMADTEGALITIFCASPAAKRRSIFLPSTCGRLIADMNRPLMILKNAMNCNQANIERSEPNLKSVRL